MTMGLVLVPPDPRLHGRTRTVITPSSHVVVLFVKADVLAPTVGW